MDRTKLRRGLDYNVGGNVRRLAGMHLVSQGDLASRVGISRQALNNLVQGRSGASATTLKVLADFFGVGIDDLYAEPHECLEAAVKAFEIAPASRHSDKVA